MKILLTILLSTCFLACNESNEDPDAHQEMNQSLLRAGDTVFMSTNISREPFNGHYQIDENGMVAPKSCNGHTVKIGGLNEEEASTAVATLAYDLDVFNPISVSIRVVKTARLPTDANQAGQQGTAQNPVKR